MNMHVSHHHNTWNNKCWRRRNLASLQYNLLQHTPVLHCCYLADPKSRTWTPDSPRYKTSASCRYRCTIRSRQSQKSVVHLQLLADAPSLHYSERWPGQYVLNCILYIASCTGPFEAPGHPCTELSGRLAHSGSLQGASESSQGYRSRPHPFSWSQDERQEECTPSISTNRISSNSFGFRSDAGPFGSCPDTSFYSMFGPLQARPSCLCRYLPQAVGPYGSSLPCVAPRAASHEVIPLVDEGAEVTPHCTSYSPYQSVAQLLSTPVNVARPQASFRLLVQIRLKCVHI